MRICLNLYGLEKSTIQAGEGFRSLKILKGGLEVFLPSQLFQRVWPFAMVGKLCFLPTFSENVGQFGRWEFVRC